LNSKDKNSCILGVPQDMSMQIIKLDHQRYFLDMGAYSAWHTQRDVSTPLDQN